jgi:hypothetical protein
VRAATVGTITPALPITGAAVTYVRPKLGSDPAGFFVQGETTGPALFVAVDPTTLDPVPAVGDIVSLEVSGTAVVAGLLRATAIGAFTRTAIGADISTLVQDASSVDLVAALDEFDSELITVDATIANTFGACSAPYVCAQITTEGVTTASNGLRFRTIPTVIDAFGVRVGCVIKIGPTPLWRFSDPSGAPQAQPSAWVVEDLTVTSCPAPVVASAASDGTTSVTVNFNTPVDPASVTAGAFTIDKGVTVSAATADGRSVVLTTSELALETEYTVTVAASVTDLVGTALSRATNTATFSVAFAPISDFVINEVDYDVVDAETTEFVELFNAGPTPISLVGKFLIFVNGNGNAEYILATSGTARTDLAAAGAVLEPGQYLLVHGAALTPPAGALSISFEGGTLGRIQNGAPDAIGIFDTVTGEWVDRLSYEGETLSPGGTLPAGSMLEGPVATTGLADVTVVGQTAADVHSIARIPNGVDTGINGNDFKFTTTATPGAANVLTPAP